MKAGFHRSSRDRQDGSDPKNRLESAHLARARGLGGCRRKEVDVHHGKGIPREIPENGNHSSQPDRRKV